MVPAACAACGKSWCKLRCVRCHNAWFCSRECQLIAARQGHSGANCCPAGASAAEAVEVAPRVPAAAGPSTTAPGVDSASLAPLCHACGKNDAKLLRCGRCRGVWFCNRECQVVARKELGHRGANCRPADEAQNPATSANARSPFAAPPRPSSAIDVADLCQRFSDLFYEASQAAMAYTRVGYLAAVEKAKEATAVADLIDGVEGAFCRAEAGQLLVECLLRGENVAAAARAACSSLRSARASGSRTFLVSALSMCGAVAQQAPDEMVKAERESREQERLGGSPSYFGLDLSQEGRIRLPTTPDDLSWLEVTYYEAAVVACDAAIEAAGGRDTAAAADERRVPTLRNEAEARSRLGLSLYEAGEAQSGSELLQQAVALMRQWMLTTAPGSDALQAKLWLAALLSNMAVKLSDHDLPTSPEMADAAAYLREALELSEDTDDVGLKQHVLRHLANMSGRPDQPVKPAEAAAFRSRLNALYAQTGRNHDTSCTICLEPLEQPGSGAEQGAVEDGGRDPDGYTNSAVLVLECGHQFHRGCLSTWWRTAVSEECPLCKK